MDKNKKKWNATITLTLVKLYETQPVLYKTHYSGYRNSLMRNNALEVIKQQLEIMYKLEFGVEEICKKINNIRSQYLEVNKKVQKMVPSGSATPSWWLYEHLAFLLPFIKKVKGERNVNLSDTSRDTCEEEEELIECPNTELTPLEIVYEEDIESRVSEIDPLQVTGNKRQKNEPENPPDDIRYFVNYLESELREIKSKDLFRKCKRELLSVVMKYQDEVI